MFSVCFDYYAFSLPCFPFLSLSLSLSLCLTAMAWRSSGATNEELCDRLHENGVVRSKRVVKAMKQVDRKLFIPDGGEHLVREGERQKCKVNTERDTEMTRVIVLGITYRLHYRHRERKQRTAEKLKKRQARRSGRERVSEVYETSNTL